tara:strand:+ start:1798 stop:2739 length:942 start_codon:yes stop_codon:yes gene_type:complete
MNMESKTYINQLDIETLVKLLWANKKIIISITFFFAMLSIIIALSIQNKYTSSSLVKIVNSDEQSSNASSLLSSYGGLASLSGIDISSLSDEKASYVIALIKSKKFLSELLKKDDSLTQNIFAMKKFYPESGKVDFYNSIYNQDEDKWVRKKSIGRSIKPSYIELHEYYLSALDIHKDKDSGFIKISFTSKSPIFAFNMLEMILAETNLFIKEDELKRVEDALKYLSSKLETVTTDETISTINQLIEVNLKKEALANINEEYFIKKIDYPFIAESKSSPNRAVICILLTFLGFLLSLAYVLVKNYLKNEDQRS